VEGIELVDVLRYVETVLVGLFIFEFALQLAGLGWQLYTDTSENVMDMFILIVTVIGTVATYRYSHGTIEAGFDYLDLSPGTIRAMRLGRVAQAFRMLYKNKSMFDVMSTILKAWKGILGIFVFVTFSLAMFAIITMHVVGGALPPGTPIEEYPRSNFETFSSAFLTLMQFLIGLEWSKVMVWYIEHATIGYFAAPYFCVLYFWIHGMLYSLFVAVLLINFAVDEDEKIPMQRTAYAHYRQTRDSLQESNLMKALAQEQDRGGGEDIQETLVSQLTSSADYTNRKTHQSFYIFTCTNPLRLFCAYVQDNPLSTNIMLCLITFSLTFATLEGKEGGDINQTYGDYFRALEVGILVSFYIEMIVKSIVGGFWMQSGPTEPYIKRYQNRNNFVVLVIITATYVPALKELFTREQIQVIRGLLPMVGLLQHVGLATVVNSFLSSLPSVGTVSIPVVFIGVVFSIVGVEYFGGKFKQCVCVSPEHLFPDDIFAKVEGMNKCCPGEAQYREVGGVALCTNATMPILDETSCLLRGYSWTNPPNVGHFDDVISGAMALFKTATADYIEIMQISMDVTQRDQVREMDASASYSTFYLVYLVIFNLFLLNLFIGVLGSSFSVNTGTATITHLQKRWMQCDSTVMSFEPVYVSEEAWRPELDSSFAYRPRMKIFNIVTTRMFIHFSYVMVVFNCVMLCAEHYPTYENEYISAETVIMVLNTIITTWFTLEMVMKIFAFGIRNYFSDNWLAFDAVVVCSAILLRIGGTPTGVEFLKIFRCLKLLFLAKSLHSLVDLMQIVAVSIAKATNVLTISLVIFYIYAIYGVKQYGTTPLDNPTINVHNNFSTFFQGMQLLFQVACGQNYTGMITDLVRHGAGVPIQTLNPSRIQPQCRILENCRPVSR
jgi:hypothetical protein